MIALLQRVSEAKLFVGGEFFSSIGEGILVLLSLGREDEGVDFTPSIKKMLHLRMFLNEDNRLGLSVLDVGGEIMLVSQFTLHGEIKKGQKPSFSKSAPKIKARVLFQKFHDQLKKNFKGKIALGQFGEEMKIMPTLAGPVTFILGLDK